MTKRMSLTCFVAVSFLLVSMAAAPASRALASYSAAVPGSHAVPGAVPAAVADGAATPIGTRPTTDTVSFTVNVAMRNLAALFQFLQDFNNPSSPSYRNPLTLAEANQLFNPTGGQEQQVISWLQANGFTVSGTYPNHLLVDAQGTVGQVESVFHITINEYRATVRGKDVTFYAPAQNPSVPAALAGLFNGIIGLDTYPRFFHDANGNAHGAPAYYPQDFANAYDLNPLWNAGYTGAGQHIGITLWETPPADQTLQAFAGATGASVATVGNGRLKIIPVDGGNAIADDGEAGMDIEYSSGMAPGATIDYYMTPTDSSGNPTDQGLLDGLNLAGTDANNNRQITNSWGGCEASSASDSFVTAAEQIFAANTATGHNYFFSSGDNGSACNPNDPNTYVDPYPNYPTSSAYVTSVGGTEFTGNIGSTDPGEVAWHYCANCNGAPEGSGGGYSQIFNHASWQIAPGFASGRRGYPDISAVGDPHTGAFVCYGGGATCGQIGGTSLSSPMWAGITADLNQYVIAQGKPALGFMNPHLYSLANTAQTYAPYHDVTAGTNGAYSASSGWDPVTGLGTPDAWNIARDLAHTSTSTNSSGGPSITATPNPVSAGSSSSTISWNTGDGSAGQLFVSVNGGADQYITAGASGSFVAPWISAGYSYTFRLYAGTSHVTQLAAVIVTSSAAAAPGAITAGPNPVTLPAGSNTGSTTIGWNTGDQTAGQVYVSADGGADQYFAGGASGSAAAAFITAGHTYTFKLFASTSHVTQLAAVIVTVAGSNGPGEIAAGPNPVTLSPGSTMGSTNITWNTGDGTAGQVFVSVNGGADQYFNGGPSGSVVAPWIQPGFSYTFKLFAGGSHVALLAAVIVDATSAPAPGAITAGPNPVTVAPGSNSGSTSISWNTGDGSAGQVFVSVDGGADQYFAGAASGSASAPWISVGHTYTFKLYAGTNHATLLAATIVTAAGANSPGAIAAGPDPVTVPQGSTSGPTTVTWNTGTSSAGQVFVSVNGAADQYFTGGVSGAAIAPWITVGYSYTFKLYAGTNHATLLSSIVVTAVANPAPNCPGSQTGCMQAMLAMLNQDRANAGVAPLTLSLTQSNGTGNCVGSIGHSMAMQQTGLPLWHTNPSYPNASAPNNFCVPYTAWAENVGMASYGNELTDLQQIDQSMMAEPHDLLTCNTQYNHACNIINSGYTGVGIGIYYVNNQTWLTEDFFH